MSWSTPGNANAATGRPGLDDAAKIQGAASAAAGLAPEQVAVCSTGVIGVPLDADAIVRALPDVRARLDDAGDAALSEAIQTTDAFEKRASLEVSLEAGTVRLSAQAKGAGMISPHFATLLCFVETDAALDPAVCDLLLGATCARSFERVSVDGQLSTNDTVLLMASGASGVRVAGESVDELAFGEALDALMRQLALLVVRDGEGAERVGRVVALGGHHMQSRPRPARLRTRHWSRPPCTAATPTGGGSPRRWAPRCPAPRRSRSTSRLRASR